MVFLFFSLEYVINSESPVFFLTLYHTVLISISSIDTEKKMCAMFVAAGLACAFAGVTWFRNSGIDRILFRPSRPVPVCDVDVQSHGFHRTRLGNLFWKSEYRHDYSPPSVIVVYLHGNADSVVNAPEFFHRFASHAKRSMICVACEFSGYGWDSFDRVKPRRDDVIRSCYDVIQEALIQHPQCSLIVVV